MIDTPGANLHAGQFNAEAKGMVCHAYLDMCAQTSVSIGFFDAGSNCC